MNRKKPRTVAEGWVPNRHGITSSYLRGCRCVECRAANARRQREGGGSRRLEARRKAERVMIDGVLVHPAPYGGHGSVSAYTVCGCRCTECRVKNGERSRARRDKQRVEAQTHHTPLGPPVEIDVTSVFSY